MLCLRGSAFLRKRHSPAPPLQNLFGGFLLAGADVKPTPQRNGRHIKKRGEDFCKSPLPAPSFKNFKAFCGWRKALYSWHKLPPPHRSEPRRHDTPRAEPCLPDTAAQNLVSPCPRFLRYTTAPRKPPPVGATTGRPRFPQITPPHPENLRSWRGDHRSPAVSPTHRRAPQKLRSCRGDHRSPAFPADHTAAPRKPPLRRGDHWSPANTAPPVNGRRRFYPSFFRAASAAAAPAASPIAQQSAVTR